jgi:hypothetical protein
MYRNTVVPTYLFTLILSFVQPVQAAERGGDSPTGTTKKVCRSPMPANVQEKMVKCPDGTVATISVVSMGQGSESICEDTHLHCDGRLLMNVFGGCAFKAICWEATGAQAKVWYVAVPGPTPPTSKK